MDGRPAGRRRGTPVVLLALLAAIPLWGYWRATRYGDLWVTVHDVARADDGSFPGG
jgi:hypothetical protein